MSMSLEEVSQIFNEIGWKHQVSQENDVIISGGGNATSTLGFITRMREDGDMFDMSGSIMDDESNVINAKENAYINVLMSYLLLRNYQTKFGTWEFNHEDGTISFAVEIPLEDNKLTAKQLKRITGLMNSAGEEADTIKHILAYGTLPLESDDAAKKIAELEAMIAKLQGEGI